VADEDEMTSWGDGGPGLTPELCGALARLAATLDLENRPARRLAVAWQGSGMTGVEVRLDERQESRGGRSMVVFDTVTGEELRRSGAAARGPGTEADPEQCRARWGGHRCERRAGHVLEVGHRDGDVTWTEDFGGVGGALDWIDLPRSSRSRRSSSSPAGVPSARGAAEGRRGLRPRRSALVEELPFIAKAFGFGDGS
jgi:hypothetical protein